MILLDKEITLENGFKGYISNGNLYHLDGTVSIPVNRKTKRKKAKKNIWGRKVKPVLVEKTKKITEETTYTYYV